MISILFSLAMLTGPVRAEDPRAPTNVRFSYVCKYGLSNGQLTCRDVLGNKLVDRVRVFSYQLLSPYDDVAVIAMMKREGFDLTAKVTYSALNTFLYFIRAPDRDAAK